MTKKPQDEPDVIEFDLDKLGAIIHAGLTELKLLPPAFARPGARLRTSFVESLLPHAIVGVRVTLLNPEDVKPRKVVPMAEYQAKRRR